MVGSITVKFLSGEQQQRPLPHLFQDQEAASHGEKGLRGVGLANRLCGEPLYQPRLKGWGKFPQQVAIIMLTRSRAVELPRLAIQASGLAAAQVAERKRLCRPNGIRQQQEIANGIVLPLDGITCICKGNWSLLRSVKGVIAENGVGWLINRSAISTERTPDTGARAESAIGKRCVERTQQRRQGKAKRGFRCVQLLFGCRRIDEGRAARIGVLDML
jgi:hypothetical protein